MPHHAPEPATLDQQQILDALKRLADGDLSVQLPTGQGGTAGEIADTFNGHVRMLNNFASELTRVAREMGTDGRYGPQAEVAGLAGFWKLMVDEVNVMAAQLTYQIRDIGNVARAISHRDLSRRLTAPANGEMADLQETMNGLIERRVLGLDK